MFEAIKAAFCTQMGQALASAAVNQVISIIAGEDKDTAAAAFSQACDEYRAAVAEWEKKAS